MYKKVIFLRFFKTMILLQKGKDRTKRNNKEKNNKETVFHILHPLNSGSKLRKHVRTKEKMKSQKHKI